MRIPYQRDLAGTYVFGIDPEAGFTEKGRIKQAPELLVMNGGMDQQSSGPLHG